MAFKIHNQETRKILGNSNKITHKTNSLEKKNGPIISHKHTGGIEKWFKEIKLPNFIIRYSDNKSSRKTNLMFEFEEETVEMHFTLKGKAKCKIKNDSTNFKYISNTHHIFYCNPSHGKIIISSTDIYILKISLKIGFLYNYLPNDNSVFTQFKKLIINKKAVFLGTHNYPITPQMMGVIQQIINCNRKGTYKCLFLESKILELLLLQLDQISSYDLSTNKKIPECCERIVSKMTKVQEIILSKLDQNLLLSDLAKTVCTNKCTLKKEFKKLFGTTIHKYIIDNKMIEAKKLLMDKGLLIKEVSETVGYKNPQHFSSAFKRKFGFSPSKLKRKIVSEY